MDITEQIKEVLGEHINLTFNSEINMFHGALIVDKQDNDKYYINIDISGFPTKFPKVWEIAERIPRKADRHINTKTDLSCCFTTLANEEILLKTKIHTLHDFINFIVIPYFQNNSYYESNRIYKFGEYSHFPELSTYETYKEILNLDNIYKIREVLHGKLIYNTKYRPNDNCFCGSNQKLKKCKNHEVCYKNFRYISLNTMRRDYSIIDYVIKAHFNQKP